MSGAGGLDVRLPIGGLFSVLGLMLTGYGLVTGRNLPSTPPATTVNINLWWGLVMLIFGVLLLWLAALDRRKLSARRAAESAEGMATEKREHQLGLER